MSLHPRNAVLLFVLLVLVAANVFLARPVTQATEGGSLVAPFEREQVARIEIDGAADDPVVLERAPGQADAAWRVTTRFGFPAYAYAVDELIAGLSHLARNDRVGEEASAHEMFGVGANGTRITLFDAGGRALAAVVQGAPSGLATGSTVRLAAADDVYRAPAFARVGTQPGAWLDTRLCEFDPAAVRGVTLSSEGGRIFLDLSRDADGWRNLEDPAPTYVSRTHVERMLQIASTLVFSDVVANETTPEQGFDVRQESPGRTLLPQTYVDLDMGDDERRMFWIGLPIEGDDSAGTDARAYYSTNPLWPEHWCVSLPAPSAELLFATIDALAGR